MKRRGFFWFAGLCLVLCAVSSKAQFLIDDKIGNVNNNIKSDQKWSEENKNNFPPTIDGNKAGCSKYCILNKENAETDTEKRMNVIWNIVDDSVVTFTRKLYNEQEISEPSTEQKDFTSESSRIFNKSKIFTDDDANCQIYLQLGCEAPSKSNTDNFAFPDEFLNRHERNLVTMGLTEGYTEKEFIVDEVTEELRMSAFGKLSEAIIEIPIGSRAGDSSDARTTRPTLSLSRTNDGTGVRFDARNPPSGGWRLKLVGVENSNYNFTVVATSFDGIVEESDFNIFKNAISQSENVAKPEEELSKSQRLADLKIGDNTGRQTIRSHDQQREFKRGLDRKPEEESTDKPEMLDYPTSNESSVKADVKEITDRKFVAKFRRGADGEAEEMEPQANDRMISGRSSNEDPIKTAKIVENSELEELSRSVGEIQARAQKTVVDISPNAQLIARPGFHDVVFTVTNNQPLEIKHNFRGRSTPFPIVVILPNDFLWIKSGETIQIAIRIQVPNTQDTTPGTVTLYVEANLEVAEKSTYIYVQGSSQTPSTDNSKPSIDYTFNDNCNGKLHRDRCSRSLWSVEVTARDSDSGLKTVTSLPKGVEPRTEFISGTKNAVTFYYVSTCCYTTVDIKATDVQGNIYTRTIDVTDWDNLSQGEIAAIVVGALMILLLIILIILLIIYCVRKRKSHDLSYSQRYGSRAPASAERTNF